MPHTIGKLRLGVGTLCLGLYLVRCANDEPPPSAPDDGLENIDPSRPANMGGRGGSSGAGSGAAGTSNTAGATASNGGAGGSVTDTPPRGDAPLGAACDAELDCAAGLSCFTRLGTSVSGLMLVPGGYCSVPCAEHEDCS